MLPCVRQADELVLGHLWDHVPGSAARCIRIDMPPAVQHEAVGPAKALDRSRADGLAMDM